MDKKILDCTSASRMMWFDKNNPQTLFTDIRTEKHVLCDGRILEIKPDLEVDFTNMPFPDESFHLVLFDPPHFNKLGKTSWMGKKYGVLGENWKEVIGKGFSECYRVLKPNGVLVFKWNENQIKLKDVRPLFPTEPLFGHTTSKGGHTIWVTFMK